MSWLWKGDTNSPASFEKALSKLSSQITAANLALDTTRSRARRAKALWTLYTTLTYLLYSLVISLVLGPQNWSAYHYGGLLGAPVLIYALRRAITAISDWRIRRQQAYLDHLQKQREAKIADLKKATRYDSTQELLQKYGGGSPNKPASKQPPQGSKKQSQSHKPPQPQHQRTGIPPPPTANIPGRHIPSQTPPIQPPSLPASPMTPNHGQSPLASHVVAQSPSEFAPDSPGFAPNAFPQVPPPPPSTAYEQPPHWYDRILDVLLGEDETAAKNRLVMLCSSCRLVNGQAPPGVRTLEELGRWRCAACGSWNGAESEGIKVVKEITRREAPEDSRGWEKVPKAGEMAEESPTQLDESGAGGSTGHESPDEPNLTKRVTRSAGKKNYHESSD